MTDFQFPSMEDIRRRNTLCITTKSPSDDDWVLLDPSEAEGHDVVEYTWAAHNHELHQNDWVVVNRPSPFRVWLANILQKIKNI